MNSTFFIEERIYMREEIPDDLIQKQYFSPYREKNKYKLKVTGISITNKDIYYFLPKNTGVELTNVIKKELGKLTLRSILKYRNENRLSSKEEYWLGRTNSNIELFDTVYWLIDDYKNYGVYIEEEIYMSKDTSNPINWNKTIKNTQPLIIDKQIVYPDLITYSKQTNHYSVLSAIHNNILLEITQKYGWLFSVSERKKRIQINLSFKQQITYLRQKLNQTTNTRVQMLIKNILAFLKCSELEDQTLDMITPYFQYVWEDAIQQVFNHNFDLQFLVGKPYWKFKNGEKKKSNQFPDALIETKDSLVIIDAKYYSMDETLNNNLPGWNSLVKQMYYNLSINKHYETINNFFLIPRYSGVEKKVDYIGYASVEDYENRFGLVYAFNLNTRLLLENYLLDIVRPDLIKLLLDYISKLSK